MSERLQSQVGYQDRLNTIKQRVVSARLRVTLAANSELIALYYEIGAQLVDREAHARWGSGFIDAFSKDLRQTFPEVGSFSSKNLRYCRALIRFYCDPAIWQQAVAKLPDTPGLESMKRLPRKSPGFLGARSTLCSYRSGTAISKPLTRRHNRGHWTSTSTLSSAITVGTASAASAHPTKITGSATCCTSRAATTITASLAKSTYRPCARSKAAIVRQENHSSRRRMDLKLILAARLLLAGEKE